MCATRVGAQGAWTNECSTGCGKSHLIAQVEWIASSHNVPLVLPKRLAMMMPFTIDVSAHQLHELCSTVGIR